MERYVTRTFSGKRTLEFLESEGTLKAVIGGVLETTPTNQAMIRALLRDIEEMQKKLEIEHNKIEKMVRKKVTL